MDTQPAVRMPLSLDQVTAQWITEEFQPLHPGIEVTRLTIDHVIGGTATKLLLSLDYNDVGTAAGMPSSMCLKIGLDPAHLRISRSAYAAEGQFYRDILPDIPGLTLPRCYLARTDEATGQTAIFLEDLRPRGARFGDIRDEPVSLEVIRNLIDWLAILHARFWDDPMLDQLNRFPTDTIGGWMGHVLQPEVWPHYMATERAARAPAELRDRDNVHNAYLAMQQANAAHPQCLIHGDLHAGNLYFEPDGTAAFLDWQGLKCGHWAFDFAYFMAGNLTIEDRRTHERAFLRLYLDRLAVHLASFQPQATAPGWDEAWLSYRQNTAHGTGWIACPTTSQPEEICALNSQRISTAADDLDLLGAVGLRA